MYLVQNINSAKLAKHRTDVMAIELEISMHFQSTYQR